MRSEIGKIPLDNVFKEREALNYSIVRAICKAAEPWGIECLRYEIRKRRLNILLSLLTSWLQCFIRYKPNLVQFRFPFGVMSHVHFRFAYGCFFL